MKLLFSETSPDDTRYLYPYVVWAFLEENETPADAFAAGFLPSGPNLDRFYLVRQIRVPLRDWRPSSENRRILRKGSQVRLEVIPKSDFTLDDSRRDRWLAFAEERFGAGIMPLERLMRIWQGPVISHVLHVTDAATGAELGTVLMYLEAPRVAYYYYAFYDLTSPERNLGMQLMTRAVEHFRAAGFDHLHLGTCVTEAALYKTQFEPLEFFNGARWSNQVAELKHLVRSSATASHRFEEPEFLAFQPATAVQLAAQGPFRVAKE